MVISVATYIHGIVGILAESFPVGKIALERFRKSLQYYTPKKLGLPISLLACGAILGYPSIPAIYTALLH